MSVPLNTIAIVSSAFACVSLSGFVLSTISTLTNSHIGITLSIVMSNTVSLNVVPIL